MREYILFFFNFLLCVLCLVACADLKKYVDVRYEATCSAFAMISQQINEQAKDNALARQHCDDVARCIIEEAW